MLIKKNQHQHQIKGFTTLFCRINSGKTRLNNRLVRFLDNIFTINRLLDNLDFFIIEQNYIVTLDLKRKIILYKLHMFCQTIYKLIHHYYLYPDFGLPTKIMASKADHLLKKVSFEKFSKNTH